MSTARFQTVADGFLRRAGVTLNGSAPWDLQVRYRRFFRRVLTDGDLGLGESYMEGWWDAPRVDEFITRILRARLEEAVGVPWGARLGLVLANLANRQSHGRAFVVGERHYDLGNELFSAMLDARMNYSCAYWEGASSLDQA